MATSAGGEVLPGEQTLTVESLLVEMTTEDKESFAAMNRIHHRLCAFNFYARDMTRQVQEHYFCAHQDEVMRHYLIYDRPDASAELIGMEYIISEGLFRALPDEEKKLWHAHEYEVKDGLLFMPGVPGTVQRQELEKLRTTYGKTFHFWQVDKSDTTQVGLPNLMAALADDGQLDDALSQDVEKKMGMSFDTEREGRRHIPAPEDGIHLLADLWKKGKGVNAEISETDCLNAAMATARVSPRSSSSLAAVQADCCQGPIN